MVKKADSLSEVTLSQVLAKLLLSLTLLAFILSAWLFVSWLYKPGNFPVRKLELVNKLENQESSELIKVADSVLNGGFFSLNIEQFRADLLAKLPWVKSVSVRKIWPNKLMLSITEHKPIVRWLSVKQLMTTQGKEQKGAHTVKGSELLSREGIIFRPDLTPEQQTYFDNLVLLTGPENSAGNVLQNCFQMKDILQQLETGIKQCGMNERRTWMILLDNGIDIKLGKENILRQLERFVWVFSGQLRQYINSVDYADLRYSNGFSIRWNSENAVQSSD